MGSSGAVRSKAWVWDFSSKQTTTALSGGFSYRLTTSRTLASNCGSVENLKRLHPVRLQVPVPPDPGDLGEADRRARLGQVGRQQPRRPVRHPELVRWRVERRHHHRRLIHCGWTTRPRHVHQHIQPTFGVPDRRWARRQRRDAHSHPLRMVTPPHSHQNGTRSIQFRISLSQSRRRRSRSLGVGFAPLSAAPRSVVGRRSDAHNRRKEDP